MGNSPRGSGSSKLPDEYYYEKLGPKVRKALQDSVIEWSSKWCYKMMENHGADAVIKILRNADQDYTKKGWKLKPFVKNAPSPCVFAKVQILRANW